MNTFRVFLKFALVEFCTKWVCIKRGPGVFECDFRKASTQNYISLASSRSSPLFPKYISNPITTLCFVNTQNDKLIQKLAGAAPYKMKFSPANAFDPKKPEHENSLQVYPKWYILFACSYPFRTWTWCDFFPSYVWETLLCTWNILGKHMYVWETTWIKCLT